MPKLPFDLNEVFDPEASSSDEEEEEEINNNINDTNNTNSNTNNKELLTNIQQEIQQEEEQFIQKQQQEEEEIQQQQLNEDLTQTFIQQQQQQLDEEIESFLNTTDLIDFEMNDIVTNNNNNNEINEMNNNIDNTNNNYLNIVNNEMNENNTNNIENNNIDIIINSNNNNNNNEMNENNHIVNVNGEEEEVEFNNNTIDNIIDNNSNDNNNNNNTNNNINNSNDSDNTNDKNNIEITVIEDNIVVEEINENEIYEITEIIDDDDNEMNDEEVIVTKTITTNNKNNNNTNDSEIIEIEDNDDNASILLDDEDEEENKKEEEEVINNNNNDNNETTMQQQEENVIQIKEVMEENNEIKEINNDNNNDNIITMNDNVQHQQLLDDGLQMSIIEPLNQQQLQQSPQLLQQQQNEMSIEPTTIIQQKEEEEQQLQQQQEELNNDSILLENDNNNKVNNIDYYQEIINKKERQKQKELEKKLKLNIVTSKIGDTILVKNLKDKQPSLKRKRINKKEQLEDENIEESDDDEEDQEDENENDEEDEDDELFNFRAIKYYKEDNNNLIRENEEDENEEEDEEQNEEEECFNFMYNSKEEFEREKQLYEQKRITKEEDDIKSNSDEDTDYFESEKEEENNNNNNHHNEYNNNQEEEEDDDEMIEEESNSSSGSGGEEREQQQNELENELEKLMKEKVEYLHNVYFNQLKKEKIYKKYILEKNFTITQLKEKLIFYKQQLNQTKIEILQNNSKLENKNLNLIFKILKRQIKYEVLLLLVNEPPIIAPFPNKKVNVNKQQQQLNKEKKELLDDMNDFIDDSNMEDEEINLKDSLMNQSPSQLETSLQSPNREEEAIKIKKIKYHIIPNQNEKNIILGNEFFNNLNFKKLLNGTVGICEILEKKIPYHFINIVMNQKVKKSAQQFKQQQEEKKEKENVNVSQLNTSLNEYKDVTNYGNLNIKIPSNIDAMDHQIDGLLFGIKQLKDKKSFIIAHEMGLGKTLTTLLLFLNYNLLTKKGSLKYLILTTKSNLNRFIDDYNYFFKNNYHFIENVIKIESSNELDKLNNYNNGIVLMSHRLLLDILKNEEIKNRILKINFNFFVIDEAQIIKNDKTQTYNSFMEIKTEFKILLSGTPLQNSLGDLFNLIKFIKNKMILNDKEFENEFIKCINNNPINSKLNKFRLKLFTLLFNDSIHRVLFKESKLMDIKKYQHLIFYKPNLEILNIYDILQNKNVNFFTLNKTLRVILDAGSFIYNYSSKNSNNTIIEEQFEEEMIEEEIMNEQIKKNIYNSITSLVDKEIIPLNIEIKENNKIKILQNLINSIKVNDETDQIVIFTNYISYLPFLINELKKEITYKIEIFTGTLTTKQRNEILFKFKNKEIDILFVSKKVGGVGIDLSNANHVIFYNLDFNYTNDLQCISRCYRNKQLKDVHVYTLLGMVNLDINLKMECHVKKATMINYVLDNIFIKNQLSGDKYFENCKERMKSYLDKFDILNTFNFINDEKDELLIGQDNLITSDNEEEEVDDDGFKCHCNEFFKRYPHLKKLNFFN